MSNNKQSYQKLTLKTMNSLDSSEKIQSSLCATILLSPQGCPLQPQIQMKSSMKDKEVEKNPGDIWTQEQKALFCIFWMKKFISSPYDTFSFYQPLKRIKVYKQLSDFINQKKTKQGPQGKVVVTPRYCKTRFSTIRKTIMKHIRVGKLKSEDYDLITYIEEESLELSKEKVNEKLEKYLVKLNKLKKEKKSELMEVVNELNNFENEENQKLQTDLHLYFSRLKSQKQKSQMELQKVKKESSQ